jgi:hypothetical protein
MCCGMRLLVFLGRSFDRDTFMRINGLSEVWWMPENVVLIACLYFVARDINGNLNLCIRIVTPG